MTPQEQLSAYENGYQEDLGVGRYACAPKAFEALRVVLDLADRYDRLNDRMWTTSAADEIRAAITTALGETS